MTKRRLALREHIILKNTKSGCKVGKNDEFSGQEIYDKFLELSKLSTKKEQVFQVIF